MVEATLPKDAITKDKGAYRTQLMYMEGMALLVAWLKKAADEQFTIREAIPRPPLIMLENLPKCFWEFPKNSPIMLYYANGI